MKGFMENLLRNQYGNALLYLTDFLPSSLELFGQ